jgi:hypothetical protein
MKSSVKQWNNSEALSYFCRHLVGLCVTYQCKNGIEADRPSRFAAYSGTLINIRGAIYFLTAGHVLEELEKFLSGDEIKITSAALVDTFALGSVSHLPIPFDLKGARLSYVDDHEQGLDFGVILLEPNYVRLLAKNGMVALEESSWIHQSRVRFDGYAMLGFPAEFTSKRVSELDEGELSATMFGVKRLASPPKGRKPTKHQQFIGQLNSRLALKSVEGMSGCPIFGFRKEPDGRYRYWVVALQSSWLSSTRTVFGCSLPILASLLTEWAQVPDSTKSFKGSALLEPTTHQFDGTSPR